MGRTAVINVVGLTEALLGPATPRLNAWAATAQRARIQPAFPAVTCTAQANYLTGTRPDQHGIVANGWYDRDLAEVHFWKQSNRLVRSPKIWDDLRQHMSGFTCAKLFWWFNMFSSADYSITPRPIYPADGRKIFDIYTWPYSIRPQIKSALGEFPFPTFWGPAAGRASRLGPADAATRWIAQAAQWIERQYQPTLNLVYLPHLDYNLQRLGPHHPDLSRDLNAIDQIVGQLLDFFQERSVLPLLLSEYGILPVTRPIHLNRLLRQHGWLAIKDELGHDVLDCGASQAFAVADHQIAHIYLKNPSLQKTVRDLLQHQDGIAHVLAGPDLREAGLHHARAGDLVAAAKEDAWFTYYYWLDDAAAPDFARCVDIHRKPGFDPVELFFDPHLKWPPAKIGWRLLQKQLGFRTLMDVIPLDATLVRGSHGVCPSDRRNWPLLLAPPSVELPSACLPSTELHSVIKKAVLHGTSPSP